MAVEVSSAMKWCSGASDGYWQVSGVAFAAVAKPTTLT
jgi:hypothetical protein